MQITEAAVRKIVRRLLSEAQLDLLPKASGPKIPLEHFNAALKSHKLWMTGKIGERLTIRNSDLSGLDLSAVVLRDADLRNSYLIGTNLSGADLSFTNFFNAKLCNAVLTGTDLQDTNFHSVDLRGAIFTDEFYNARVLANVLCDDEQLQWLEKHPNFSRRTA